MAEQADYTLRPVSDLKIDWQVLDEDTNEWCIVTLIMDTENIFTKKKLRRVAFSDGTGAVFERDEIFPIRTIRQAKAAAKKVTQDV